MIKILNLKLKLIIILVSTFALFYLTSVVSANSFIFENNTSIYCCEPVGALEFSASIPGSVLVNSSIGIYYSSTAVESLSVPTFRPVIRIGNNGPASLGPTLGFVPAAYNKQQFDGQLNSLVSSPRFFLAPSTPGLYQFCADGYLADYIRVNTGIQCQSYNVVSPPAGTILITANVPGASWSISGPQSHSGSGSSANYSNTSVGSYNIIWGNVAGYIKPADQSLPLSTGGVITFNGTYTAITPPSVQLNFQ